MNKKRVSASIFSLTLSCAVLAGPTEDFKLGSEAYYVKLDVITAMRYLEPAAAKGHLQAQNLLAYILDTSGENEQALVWFGKSAATGDADGEYGLGRMLALGEGAPKDEKRAVELMNSAAVKGQLQAIRWLADAYAHGKFGLPEDPAKSAQWLKQAEQVEELKK